MPRWYAGFHCFGKPDEIVSMINRYVGQNRLETVVPLMRIEREPTREFYLFLAIESDVPGSLPSELLPLLQRKEFRSAVGVHLAPEEINKMTGSYNVLDYGTRIPHVPPREPADYDPYGEASMSFETERSPSAVKEAQRYDRLMLWLSAVGTGSYATFCAGCTMLGLDDRTHFRAVLRRLRLLGHIEVSADGKRWSVAPTVLARRHSYDARWGEFFLCGQRDMTVLETLRSISDTSEKLQENGSAPSLFRIQTDDVTRFAKEIQAESSAENVVVGGQIGEQLADQLPTVKSWKQTLQPLPGLVPQNFDARLWTGKQFEPGPFEGQTGFYELWPLKKQDAFNRPQYIAFYDESEDTWVRGDWYGLRFLSYYALGGRCPVRYDASKRQLQVRADWSWPELYERALVLSSGLLPTRIGDCWIYTNVSDQLVAALSPKLGLRLEKV